MRRARGIDDVFISNLVPSPTTSDYKLKVVMKLEGHETGRLVLAL